jgi:hypothetical protein
MSAQRSSFNDNAQEDAAQGLLRLVSPRIGHRTRLGNGKGNGLKARRPILYCHMTQHASNDKGHPVPTGLPP